MMKFHKPSRLRMLGGAAAIMTLGGLSLAIGSPGLAHPHPEQTRQDEAAPGRERREERVIVRTIHRDGEAGGQHRAHRDGAAHSGPGEVQRVIVMNRGDGHPGQHRVRVIGPDGELSAPDCNNGQATNVDETANGQRTRVVLCTRGDGTPAERAERLQRARDRLASDSELSQEQRDRVTAALDREIARIRGN